MSSLSWIVVAMLAAAPAETASQATPCCGGEKSAATSGFPIACPRFDLGGIWQADRYEQSCDDEPVLDAIFADAGVDGCGEDICQSASLKVDVATEKAPAYLGYEPPKKPHDFKFKPRTKGFKNIVLNPQRHDFIAFPHPTWRDKNGAPENIIARVFAVLVVKEEEDDPAAPTTYGTPKIYYTGFEVQAAGNAQPLALGAEQVKLVRDNPFVIAATIPERKLKILVLLAGEQSRRERAATE